MSLLPPAMKITDPMPMTLGQAVKRALDPSTPIDSIRAFEVGYHMPAGFGFDLGSKEGAEMVTLKLYDYTGSGVKTYRREPTFAEMPEALRERALRDAEQSAFEDWLSRVCPSGDVEQVQAQWLESSDYLDFLELLPSPKQEGEWVEHTPTATGMVPPVLASARVQVRLLSGDESAPQPAGQWLWCFCGKATITHYRVVPE
jgi:hypothetical protein